MNNILTSYRPETHIRVPRRQCPTTPVFGWALTKLCGLLFCAGLLANVANADQSLSKALKQAVKHSESRAVAPLLNRDVLLNPSRVFNVKMSPDGQSIAYRQSIGNRNKKLASMWLYDIKTGTAKNLFTAKYNRQYHWSADSNSLFLIFHDRIGVSRIKANAAPMVIVNIDAKLQEKWLNVDHQHPDSFLVQLWDKTSDEYVVNRVNDQGQKTEVYRTKQRFDYFSAEPLLIRALNTAKGNRGESIIYDISGGKSKAIWQCEWDDPCTVLHYSRPTNRLLMKSNKDSDLARLLWADVNTGQLQTEHQDPLNTADVKGFVVRSSTGVKMVSYLGDHTKTYGLTPAIQQHIDTINKAIDSPTLHFDVSANHDIESTPWLITDRSSQRAQKDYYLYDPKSQITSPILKALIAQANVGNVMIKPAQMATTVAIHYPASDGFVLQGYVTLPPGINIKTAPLVVNPHGGPWGRVDDKYDHRRQFLANRGYIVFQPNFRASTGFGKHYVNSVKGDFGDGRIQQDIIDGVHYLLGNNIGDKKRVAIAGHSFGGFSVLAGLSFTPELFKVGFAGAPPSDIGRSMKKYAKFEKKNQRQSNAYAKLQLVVDWENPDAVSALYKRSPDNHGAKITKPLMIWAGEHDDRVFVVDVKEYALKLQSLGKKVSLFVDPYAKHGPRKQVSEQAYFYLMEKTLAEHIGGRVQALDDKKDLRLIRFLRKHRVI